MSSKILSKSELDEVLSQAKVNRTTFELFTRNANNQQGISIDDFIKRNHNSCNQKLDRDVAIGTVLAFIAGVIIAESKVHSVTRVIVTPIRDMFAAIFFVSVGALMDIRLLVIFIVLALVLIVISIAAKFLTVFLSSRTQGISLRTSIRTAFGLSSSGGELAQVVAKGGVDVGVSSSFILPMVGSMTIITTFITPYMVKIGWKIADALDISDNNRSNNNKKT
jgi:CPA2 family monovalent cation:H+ antiporter-2